MCDIMKKMDEGRPDFMIKQWILSGARAMGVALDEAQADKLVCFHRMLEEGNRRMNLTRVLDDAREAVDRHYLDSLAPLAAGLFEGVDSLIDVGTGAGFPGVPLSIARADMRVVLLDSLGKRVDFLNDVIEKLGLNARAVHARSEEAARLAAYRERFDAAAARAVAATATLMELTLPFVRVGGRVIAYKGPSVEEELPAARAALAKLGGGEARLTGVAIPGRDWDHRLLAVKKIRPTPAAYPRKPGEPLRRPIA